MSWCKLKNGLEELILADKSLGTGWFVNIRSTHGIFVPRLTKGITSAELEARRAFAEKHGITTEIIARVINRKYQR